MQRRKYPQSFAALNVIYPGKMQAVFEKADTLSTADYLSQVSVIKTEKEAAQNAVFEQLTQAALRIDDLGICALPGS
jgi:hypothetical protein